MEYASPGVNVEPVHDFASHAPARAVGRFEQGDVNPLIAERICRGKACRSTADYDDFPFHTPLSFSLPRPP